jgi:Domain of unknown function (DUF6894)
MPTYRFSISNDSDTHWLEDEEPGTELRDDDEAQREAMHVVRDLRKNTRIWQSWKIVVRQDDRLVWTAYFADVP